MEFVSSFLDLERWVTLIQAIILPFQTMADLTFNLLPTLLGMINDILLILGDIAELGVEFGRDVLDILIDLFQGGIYPVFKQLLDLATGFIDWFAGYIEEFFDFIADVLEWFGFQESSDFPFGDGFQGGGMGAR